MMTQTERIEYMERLLNEAADAVCMLSAALDRYDALKASIGELEAYYTGPQWMRDYEDECDGLLPEGFRRGVLSEDAVYDLLELRDALHARMARIAGQRRADGGR